MTRYEVIFVVHPDRTDEEARKVAERVGEVVAREGGQVLKVEEWGKRKLAYEVKKQSKGIYLLMHMAGTGKVVSEVERALRISDDVLKYLTVALDERDVAAASASAPAFQPAGAARRPAEGGEEGTGEEPVAAAAAAEGEQETE